jgi:hypothetical protein
MIRRLFYKMRISNKWGRLNAAPVVLLALGGATLSAPAQGAENGNISWPIGVNTVLNGVATAPGETRLYNYSLFYSANQLNDDAGDDSGVDVDAEIFVNALRIDRGWGMVGRNTHLVSGFVLPYVDASVTLFGDESTDTGFGNLSLKPLIIGTHNDAKTLFMQIAPLDLDVPTGSYDQDRAANAAVNYTSWQPNAGYSWFPAPGWEIGGTLSAAVNTENDDTDYPWRRPGAPGALRLPSRRGGGGQIPEGIRLREQGRRGALLGAIHLSLLNRICRVRDHTTSMVGRSDVTFLEHPANLFRERLAGGGHAAAAHP